MPSSVLGLLHEDRQKDVKKVMGSVSLVACQNFGNDFWRTLSSSPLLYNYAARYFFALKFCDVDIN